MTGEKVLGSLAVEIFGTLMDGLGRATRFNGGLVVPFINQHDGAGGEQQKCKQANGVGFGVGELHANNEAFTRSGGHDFVGEQVFNHALWVVALTWAKRRSRAGHEVYNLWRVRSTRQSRWFLVLSATPFLDLDWWLRIGLPA